MRYDVARLSRFRAINQHMTNVGLLYESRLKYHFSHIVYDNILFPLMFEKFPCPLPNQQNH